MSFGPVNLDRFKCVQQQHYSAGEQKLATLENFQNVFILFSPDLPATHRHPRYQKQTPCRPNVHHHNRGKTKSV